MKQNLWIGLGFILFGAYALLRQFGIAAPIDIMLILAIAFVAGYFFRKASDSMDAFPLLIVGGSIFSVYANQNLDSLLPQFGIHGHPNFMFLLGASFMIAFGVETLLSGYKRRHAWALWVGGFLALFGGYSTIISILGLSPAFVSSLIFPFILILIGASIVFRNYSPKKS